MDYKASEYLITLFDFNIVHMELNTALFVFVLVLIVMFSLNRLLFRPVLRTLDNRKAHTDQLAENALKDRQEIERLIETYTESLERVRGEVAQVRSETRKETQQAVEAILGKARAEAQAELQQALAELEREVSETREALQRSARELADQAAKRILAA